MTAVTPASAAARSPSAKGNSASLATTDRFGKKVTARQTIEVIGRFLQRGKGSELLQFCMVDLEITAQAVFEEIMLLPKIERGIEFSRQIRLDRFRFSGRKAVQFDDFIQR